jgi:hypothetical protein
MKQIFPDLWQTRAEHPFAGVTSHAYLLVRDTGNILFYSSGLKDEYQHISRTRRHHAPVFKPQGRGRPAVAGSFP